MKEQSVSYKSLGWTPCREKHPPLDKVILLGQTLMGDLDVCFTKVVKIDEWLCFKQNGKLHILGSDMYWKNV